MRAGGGECQCWAPPWNESGVAGPVGVPGPDVELMDERTETEL